MRAEQVELAARVRSEVGKQAAKRLRAGGEIPAVVYGRGQDAQPIALEAAAFSAAIPEGAWYSTLVKLRIEGAKGAGASANAMVKEVQCDIVRRRVLSVDFQRVSLRETVHTTVPVVHVGESRGVRQGGVLEHLIHEVAVECLPTQLPEHLEADITRMEIGDSLRVRDLAAPPGVKIVTDPEEVLIVIAPPVRLEEVAPAEAVPGAVVEEVEEPEVITERAREEES